MYTVNKTPKDMMHLLKEIAHTAFNNVLEQFKASSREYGNGYSIPFEDIKKLSLPVVNIGPVSKDPHKFTERIHIKSSFEMIPDIFKYAVLELLK